MNDNQFDEIIDFKQFFYKIINNWHFLGLSLLLTFATAFLYNRYTNELYLIETLARDHELEAEDLSALRKNRAGPLLEKIKTWLALQAGRSLPSSPMGKAITYAQNQWDALNVYVEDGRLEIDNNAAERGMRPIALGRKNWLFFQSLGGGKTASVLLSLVQTAEAAGVNAKDYLRDVLVRIATEKDVKKMLPHAWKKHFEGEVTGRRNEILNLLTQGRQGE